MEWSFGGAKRGLIRAKWRIIIQLPLFWAGESRLERQIQEGDEDTQLPNGPLMALEPVDQTN